VRRSFPPLLAVLLLLFACDRGSANDAASEPFSNAPASATPSFAGAEPSASTVSPTPPAIPDRAPPARGASSSTCVDGWVTPPRGSHLFTDPLGIIRRQVPVDGDFRVVDLRMFTGPEAPPSTQGYLLEVRRWYIKLFVPSDLAYQGRFLVEERVFGRGLVAVAPYDTKGFRSPDWSGFQYDAGDTSRRPYPGLPGEWSGVRYDFVKGGAGLTIPGLPPEVRGCLAGT
jgi:hypothetical protein